MLNMNVSQLGGTVYATKRRRRNGKRWDFIHLPRKYPPWIYPHINPVAQLQPSASWNIQTQTTCDREKKTRIE